MVWQYLLRSWIQQAAQEKIFETVSSELGSSASGITENQEPVKCDIGIVVSLGQELSGIEDRIQQATHIDADGFSLRIGKWKHLTVALIESGNDPNVIAQATQCLIEVYQPDWVISAGFATALTPELKKKHFLLANEVINAEQQQFSIDLHITKEQLAATPDVHIGRLLSTPNSECPPTQRKSLAKEYAAVACDSATSLVVGVCSKLQVKCLSVRIILSGFDDRAPVELDYMTKQKSLASTMGAVFGSIMNRPSTVTDLWQLKEDAIRAANRLASFLDGILVQLLPPK